MLQFIRTVDKSAENLLVFNFKTLRNLAHYVDDYFPNTLRYCKFRSVSGHFTEKPSNSFIGREPSCCSEHIIQYVGNSSKSNYCSISNKFTKICTFFQLVKINIYVYLHRKTLTEN